MVCIKEVGTLSKGYSLEMIKRPREENNVDEEEETIRRKATTRKAGAFTLS